MGFEEDTDALFLPLSASIEIVKAFKTAIERLTPPSDATSATEGKVHRLHFIDSEKATKFCGISTLLLTGTT